MDRDSAHFISNENVIFGGNNIPLVSIGLPVHNGEEHLEEALDSILAQTFINFELIICDNASSDRTAEICMKYELNDCRIRYYKSFLNMGAAKNFNRAFQLSQGKYFLWAPHDDIFAPTFLAQAVHILNNCPQIVLCYAKEVGIDEKGKTLGIRPYSLKGESIYSLERLKSLLYHDRGSPPIFGLIRSRVLRETALIGSYNGSDQVLLAELILRGQFYELPTVTFYHREHKGRSVYVNPDRYSVTAWFDPTVMRKYMLPEWRFFWGYCQCIYRCPVSFVSKIHYYIHLIIWLRKNNFFHFKRMVEDILLLFKLILRKYIE